MTTTPLTPGHPTPPPAGQLPDHVGTSPLDPPLVQRTPRRRSPLVLGGLATGVLVLAGGGYAAFAFLSGGGAQPEDVLPADTLAFVKVDLDPAAGQKVALLSLARKFPDLTADAGDDLKASLLGPALTEAGLDYDADVAPWLGDRAALAAVPAADADTPVAPVAALQVTDAEAAAEALVRLQEADGDFVFSTHFDDYVLIAETQDALTHVIDAESTLADTDAYDADLDGLGGDQVAVAWADLTAVTEAGGDLLDESGLSGLPAETTTGRVIVGLHADSDALQLTGRLTGTQAVGGTEPTRLVDDLPGDTLAALSVSGLGKTLGDALDEAGTSPAVQEVIDGAAAAGLDLPGDLDAVFGTDFAIAVRGDLADGPQVGIRVTSPEGDRGVATVGELVAASGAPIDLTRTDDGYAAAFGTSADALFADGGLARTPSFTNAVPDAGTAAAIGYVDLRGVQEALAQQGGAGEDVDDILAHLDAVGMTASSTADGGEFTLRVTTR